MAGHRAEPQLLEASSATPRPAGAGWQDVGWPTCRSTRSAPSRPDRRAVRRTSQGCRARGLGRRKRPGRRPPLSGCRAQRRGATSTPAPSSGCSPPSSRSTRRRRSSTSRPPGCRCCAPSRPVDRRQAPRGQARRPPRPAVQGPAVRPGPARHRRAGGLGRRRGHRQRPGHGQQRRRARVTHAASALSGSSGQRHGRRSATSWSAATPPATPRGTPPARSSRRPPRGWPSSATPRCASWPSKAEDQAKILAKDLLAVPARARSTLTARFGQYGLWSSYHTGLDFNGNTGDPITSVANGVVISAGYDGAYGNKTVVQLEDGTEIWYCHQNSLRRLGR